MYTSTLNIKGASALWNFLLNPTVFLSKTINSLHIIFENTRDFHTIQNVKHNSDKSTHFIGD